MWDDGTAGVSTRFANKRQANLAPLGLAPIAGIGPVAALAEVPAGPTAALRIRDQALRLQLECVLDRSAEDDADVLVIELDPGEPLPAQLDRRRCLLLTDDPALAADLSRAGVLPRAASTAQIVAGVAAVAAGLQVRPVAERRIVGPLLTPREGEILARIGEGMSNKAIARRLGISAHTVKYHLEAVFAKLAVRSRAEAVSQGVRRGLVHL